MHSGMPGHVRTAETNGVNTAGGLGVCVTAMGVCEVEGDAAWFGQLRPRARARGLRIAARANVNVIFSVPHNERR